MSTSPFIMMKTAIEHQLSYYEPISVSRVRDLWYSQQKWCSCCTISF